MAELSITPKRNMKNLPNLLDKTKTEARERKRNILYLILSYLTEQKLVTAAEALQNEAQLNNQYQTCENIDLDIILQEYQSYYYTKFQKYPKIVRKTNDCENVTTIKARKNNSAKQRTLEKEKYLGPSEKEDFQFEIISLTSDISNSSQEITITEKLATIEKLKEVAVYPTLYPDLFKSLVTWKGVLLYGPPGTGKTLLAKAFASEGFTTFINVTSSTFVSKWRGESEKMIQVLFEVAKLVAPTTIFIDEIDALARCPHNHNTRLPEGSTNVPWNLDSSLLRRFEKRILVDLPNEDNRRELLKHYIKQPNSIQKEELQQLVEKTEHFTGSDIKTLGKEVTMAIIREKIKQINNGNNKVNILRKITCNDVDLALENIRPCTTIYDCKKYYEWKDKYGSW
ncbi:hypothetical protein NQ314_010420 [Rhamnusium bicolor]|uniref:AAA+ ATPase domain-containing protein n=1 Tax=Rhamnusium bicolor TaxID=1586634 RepID=A0AAV8XRC4_9CUCU|nr:hypothetical protein NQ314_010420 [Rhamnusium bicolor]